MNNKLAIIFIGLLLMSCSSKSINYNDLESFDEDQNLRAVIEIPVGTNDKIEYKSTRNTFETDTLDGKPRVIQFLPYPVNYGFIPSTEIDKNEENDTDALDILVFGRPLKTGQVISVKAIGILEMMDDGKKDHKILSVPLNADYQIFDINDFKDLSQNHPKLRDMITEWFLNYDKTADIKILGWFDEQKALKEVMQAQTNNQ